MSDEKDAVSAQSDDIWHGIVGLGTVNESGEGIDPADLPTIFADQVVFYATERLDEDGNVIIQKFNLIDMLDFLREYQRQGVYVDQTDSPKNYIQVSE